IYLTGSWIGFLEGSTLPHFWNFSGSAWRLTFITMSVPGIVVAILLFLVREPSRLAGEQANRVLTQASTTLRSYLQSNWQLFLKLSLGTVFASIGFNAILFWMPTILVRQSHVSIAEAGHWFGILFGAGTVLGVTLGGALYRFAAKRFSELVELRILQI